MSPYWVTVYKNDGRLDSTQAQPFLVDAYWSIERIRYEVHKFYLGATNRFARLFTEFGIELLNADDIAPMQTVVVSGGEDFVALVNLGMNWDMDNNLAAETMLEGLYTDTGEDDRSMTQIISNVNQDLLANMGTGLTNIIDSMCNNTNPDTSPINPHLQNIFNTMALPTVYLPPPHNPLQTQASAMSPSQATPILPLSTPSPGSGQTTSDQDGLSSMDTSPSNLMEMMHTSPPTLFNVMTVPGVNPSTPALGQTLSTTYGSQMSPQSSSSASVITNGDKDLILSNGTLAMAKPIEPWPASLGSMSQHFVHPTPYPPQVQGTFGVQPTIPMAGFSYNPIKATSLNHPQDNIDYVMTMGTSESDGNSEENGPTMGSSQLTEKAESHKASEQRSRDKLKTSIKELVMMVPSLAAMKKPSKAMVIQKTKDFVNHQRRVTQGLKCENDMFKQELAQLHLERSRFQHEKQLADIVTVELATDKLRYIYVDHNWEIMYGYSREEVVGRRILDVVGCPKCPLQLNRCKKVDAALDKKQPWHGLVVVQRKDGQKMACEASITCILDSAGEVSQLLTVCKHFHLISYSQSRQLLESLAKAEANDSNEFNQVVEDTRKVMQHALDLYHAEENSTTNVYENPSIIAPQPLPTAVSHQ